MNPEYYDIQPKWISSVIGDFVAKEPSLDKGPPSSFLLRLTVDGIDVVKRKLFKSSEFCRV